MNTHKIKINAILAGDSDVINSRDYRNFTKAKHKHEK